METLIICNSAGCCTANDGNHDCENHNQDQKAEIRSCKVAQVHIFRATERKHQQQNETYDRDREQDLVSEVSPHADGAVFGREIVVIICHNKYHLSS